MGERPAGRPVVRRGLPGWYPRDGRPGISPAPLATVCVLQFLIGLPDRQAAEAVRCRIDFKYALAMELDDPGRGHPRTRLRARSTATSYASEPSRH
ncbi:transposase [Streptomyces sp. NK08204]|uniref:transposase n=1 Tax=Streptomyces sp. NK08204 TaxID=2873260 RepID=UPI0035A99581